MKGAGISIATLLGVVFLVLKLCKIIAWPWILVLAPFWVPCAIVLGVLAIIGVFMLLGLIFVAIGSLIR